MKKTVPLLLLATLCVACSGSEAGEREGEAMAADAPPAQDMPNTLTAAEREAGWRLLFDGATLDGWRGYHEEELPSGWRVEEGTLHRFAGGGDLVTAEAFTNFELSLEWRVGPAGNSGIMYLGALGSRDMFRSAPEFQVLDDAGHRDGQSPLTSAGANYGLHAAPRGVVRAAGAWNQARIVVENANVEHWLNGQKVVEYVLGSPEWKALVVASKFDQWPEYGTARTGHIGLQDHGDPVWYRNIKIREIR